MTEKYFISFVEECIFNPDYKDYVAGRVEVSVGESFATEEIRFLTDKRKEFYAFRNKWDFIDVNQKQLNKIRNTIKEKYMKIKDE